MPGPVPVPEGSALSVDLSLARVIRAAQSYRQRRAEADDRVNRETLTYAAERSIERNRLITDAEHQMALEEMKNGGAGISSELMKWALVAGVVVIAFMVLKK